MQPIVRHLIACEDIQRGSSPEQFTLVNIITRIRSLDPVPFPLLYRELCVLAMCTECRGQGCRSRSSKRNPGNSLGQARSGP